MTASPPPNTPDTPQPPRRRRRLGWLLFGLAGAGAGWIGFWVLLQQVAQPFIERQVSNTLERPVEMGRVTHVSLNRIHFGPTSLPTQPDDADYGIAQAVEVRFTPLKIALQRRLELDITLKDSTAYVEEDENGNWLKIPEFEEGNLPIKIRVTAIRIQQADLDVVKRDAELQPKAPIQLQVDRGALLINGGPDDMEIEQLQGEFLAGGNFEIDGDLSMQGGLNSLKGKLATQLRNINLAEVARILPPLPVEVRQGKASANTVITLNGNPIKLETVPEFDGVARLQSVVVATPLVEPAVTVDYGNVRLQGNVAHLDGWRTRLGEDIPINIGGSLSATDVQANQVRVNLKPTAVNALLKTFEFEKLLPVPVAGAIALQAALAGPLDQPVVVGRVTNACPENSEPPRQRSQPQNRVCELRVDRLPVAGLLVDFKADVFAQRLQVERVQIQPRAGGTIVAKGIASLKGEKPVGILNAAFADLPANALLATYGILLPLQAGQIAGQARAVVPLNDWQNLKATVSTQVLGGTVDIGNIELTDKQWAGTMIAQNLKIPAPLPADRANARLRIAGRLDRFSLDTITVNGQASATLAQGQVTVPRLALRQNQFSAQVEAQNAGVKAIASQFLPAQFADIPIGTLNGRLAIAGQLRGAQLPDLVGQGAMTLGLAGGAATVQGIRLKDNQLTAQARAQNLQLAQATRLIPAKLPINATELGVASAAIAVQTNLAPLLKGNIAALLGQTTLQINAAIANLSGGQATAQATLQGGQWRATATGQTIDPTRLLPQLPDTLAQPVAGQFAFSGVVPKQLTLNSLTAQGRGNVQLATGRVALPALELKQGRLVARAQPQNLALRPFHPLLRGQLAGDVQVAVPLQNVTALTASGQVSLNQGVSVVTNPLAIAFRWGNERLTLDRLQARDQLAVQGFIDVHLAQILRGAIGPDMIAQMNLDVDARQLPLQQGVQELQQFIAPLPEATEQVALAGSVGFVGNIQST
ncbi:MAG: hypothetical protein F6J87_30000, partial [Spirulina sp. SIO3F2]|nr:hypothetical protein [Spirulina sp. SIO3F2]